jgi:hypothetical protein
MRNAYIIAETPQYNVLNKVQDLRELGIDPFLCPISEYTMLLFPICFTVLVALYFVERWYIALGELGSFFGLMSKNRKF